MREQPGPGLAIVTGAAGGIGSATAAQLAAQGWSLILCDIHLEPLEAVARRCRAAGQLVEVAAGDVSDREFPVRLLGLAAGRRIGALVHAAGLSPTMGDAARIFAVNYDATERLVRTVCPLMAAGGCAVLIASSSGYMMKSAEIDAAVDALVSGRGGAAVMALAADPGRAYTLSKRAVMRLVERQAARFGEHKARIVSISPGLIDTGMGRAEMASSAQTTAMLARTPLGRVGRADEIASVAAFVCSPAASFVSGIDIKVDGGMLAALGL